MRRILTMGAFVLCAVLAQGCSAYMAANQPGQKDVSLFAAGQPRARLIAEFGAPIFTEQTAQGRKDIFTFVQGYHGAVRAGRAVGHAVASIATIGLWEVVGTPTEGYFNGDTVSVEITYGPDDRIIKVVPLKGEEQLGPIAQQAAPPGRADPAGSGVTGSITSSSGSASVARARE